MAKRPAQIANHDPPVAEFYRRNRGRAASTSRIDSRSQCPRHSIAVGGPTRERLHLRTKPSPGLFRIASPQIERSRYDLISRRARLASVGDWQPRIQEGRAW